ncbi:hypothetical protein A0H81_14304 [Grifola frondosa]|uniref:Uncharacterized protein n=1 Tax=Grifola frondosa TaxID=5627 RepID=A0A1C7LNZ3_GRIFR|nr:hypothetical protein A0H81_14304 [Grifola frondosa]
MEDAGVAVIPARPALRDLSRRCRTFGVATLSGAYGSQGSDSHRYENGYWLPDGPALASDWPLRVFDAYLHPGVQLPGSVRAIVVALPSRCARYAAFVVHAVQGRIDRHGAIAACSFRSVTCYDLPSRLVSPHSQWQPLPRLSAWPVISTSSGVRSVSSLSTEAIDRLHTRLAEVGLGVVSTDYERIPDTRTSCRAERWSAGFACANLGPVPWGGEKPYQLHPRCRIPIDITKSFMPICV